MSCIASAPQNQLLSNPCQMSFQAIAAFDGAAGRAASRGLGKPCTFDCNIATRPNSLVADKGDLSVLNFEVDRGASPLPGQGATRT